MAKAAPSPGAGRRLKVFQAQFGFHDSVVAAPSQAAALRAWGTRQNLFAEGQARLADDPQAVKAARAHPQTPLRRVAGSNDPFELEPTSLPSVPDRPKRAGITAARPEKPLSWRAPGGSLETRRGGGGASCRGRAA